MASVLISSGAIFELQLSKWLKRRVGLRERTSHCHCSEQEAGAWTYLFFGWLVPVFRGEIGIAASHLLFTVVTFGWWQLIVCFLYNKQYMTRMLTAGWVLADSAGRNAQAAMKLGIVMPPPLAPSEPRFT